MFLRAQRSLWGCLLSPAEKAVRDHRSQILSLAASYGFLTVKVFGSVARGTSDHKSDLDLLVETSENTSLLDVGGFLMDVRDMVKVPVDVVTMAALKPRIRQSSARGN